MVVYAIDEQITVELDRKQDGFSPRSIHVYIPGHAELVEPSAELRSRRFRTEAEAATAALDELKAKEPNVLADWAKREGFF
jgi:hypothetical protein